MSKSKVSKEVAAEATADIKNFENGATHKINTPKGKGGRPKQTPDEDVKEIMNIYNVPKAWIEAIKESHIPFSIYAKKAIEEKLKADGYL